MKALSIWEPWGSAMGVGAKHNETRSWPTGYRGPLAICASKRPVDALGLSLIRRARMDDFDIEPRPGYCVAVVDLVDCVKITPGFIDPNSLEAALGDYTPGRWAWVTSNPRPLHPGVMVIGRQGLFDVPNINILPWVMP